MNLKNQFNILLKENLMTSGHSKEKKFTKEKADPRQLEIGILVEREHSEIISERTKISLDHLSGNPQYYTILIEAGLVDEQDALDLYEKFYK